MPGTILVVGGTGLLGMPVARQLQADGFDVRVYTRDADKVRRQLGDSFSAAVGNVTDTAALARAVAGCAGIHISLRGRPVGENSFARAERQGTANVVAAAAAAGVQRITYLSDLHAVAPANHALEQIAVKLANEQAIAASGIAYAVFRATVFMEALNHASRQHRLMAPSMHSRYHLLAAGDYAKMVSRFYQAAAAPSRVVAVYGPQAVDFQAAIRRYAAVVFPGRKVYTVPLWAVSLLGAVTRNQFTSTSARVLQMYRRGEPGDPAQADHSLGTPATSFDDWLSQLRQQPAA